MQSKKQKKDPSDKSIAKIHDVIVVNRDAGYEIQVMDCDNPVSYFNSSQLCIRQKYYFEMVTTLCRNEFKYLLVTTQYIQRFSTRILYHESSHPEKRIPKKTNACNSVNSVNSVTLLG